MKRVLVVPLLGLFVGCHATVVRRTPPPPPPPLREVWHAEYVPMPRVTVEIDHRHPPKPLKPVHVRKAPPPVARPKPPPKRHVAPARPTKGKGNPPPKPPKR